jgi:uncharacterized phosphatase
MKTIYFVRHGESESNVVDVIAGQTHDVHLTKNGRKQAKKVGSDLKDKNIQLIVSSPLTRAVETATIIAGEIGYNPKKIVENPLFMERSLGIYEGKPGFIYGEHLANNKIHDSVETQEQLYNRFKQGLDWIRTLKENTILLVSHGGASRAAFGL